MVYLKYDPKLREDNTFDVSVIDGFAGIIVRFERNIRADIPLCTERNPVLGSFCVSKRADSWVVAPSVFTKDRESWWAVARSYERFAPYEFLTLCNLDEYANNYMSSL